MNCPRCGCVDVVGESCPSCGVVLAKYRERARPARGTRPLPDTRTRPGGASAGGARALLGLGLLAVAVLGFFVLVPSARPRSAVVPRPPTAAPQAHAQAEAPPVSLAWAPAEAPAPAVPQPGSDAGALSAADAQAANEIAARLPEQVNAADVQWLEALVQRAPSSPARGLLVSVLLAVARADLDARQYDVARARLERAAQLTPLDARPHVGLHDVWAAQQDWPRAESAIRAALSRDPSARASQMALAYALFRQDRNREAREVLAALLENGEDPPARALLARIDGAQQDEAGMTEKRVAHFHVRYDGDAHEGVGREILRALEGHYATLKLTFDHEPKTIVPVILFAREAYYDAAGAPAWSGGVFDQIDGRIRVPIGGLDASLSPEMDGTLLHELTHAFVHDLTAGLAPREIHEGLAQYMEGRRIDQMLDGPSKAALSRGEIRGVPGFYLEALAFAEFLMAQRGQGGINALLRLMGSTGNVDRACDEAYGRDWAGLRRAFRERLAREAL